jgi:peptidoglycan/LPS O-acetylase OafA/YrhL
VRVHVRSGTEAIDGLRGLAILLVLVYHSWLFSWLTPSLQIFGTALPVDVLARTGYLGVELFFMISGFVLFFPHAEQALAGGRAPGLREFAYRRFIKIVPSYLLVLAAAAAVSRPLFPSPGALVATLANHLAFVQNFFVDALGPNISVLWSLAIEVQFYLLFPLLAWAFSRRPVVVALGLIGVALAYRYGVARCCLQIEPVTRQLPAFLDVFACGMAAAYAVVWGRTRGASLQRYAWLFTLGAFAFAAALFALACGANGVTYVNGGRERWLLGDRTLFALAGAGLAVCSCFAVRWWRALLANPVLVFLSIVSYNLYLWHTLVLIWMWKHGVPKPTLPDPHADDHWKVAYLVSGWCACLAIATAVTYVIERPLLGTVRPQTFSFPWGAVARRAGVTRTRAIARPERRT